MTPSLHAARSPGSAFYQTPGRARWQGGWRLMENEFVVHVGLSEFASWGRADYTDVIPPRVRNSFSATDVAIVPQIAYRPVYDPIMVETQCSNVDIHCRLWAFGASGDTEYTEPSGCYADTVSTQAVIECYWAVISGGLPSHWIPSCCTADYNYVGGSIPPSGRQLAYGTISDFQGYLNASLGAGAPDALHKIDFTEGADNTVIYARFGALLYPLKVIADIDVTVNTWINGKFGIVNVGVASYVYAGNYSAWYLWNSSTEEYAGAYWSCARSLNSSVIIHTGAAGEGT